MTRSTLRYMLRRCISAVVLLLLVSLLVFVALERLAPGNEAQVLTGNFGYTPAAVHSIEVRLGLTRPILVQYWSWLVKALHGNLGTSAISGERITSLVAEEAPVSLELAFLSLIIATIIGIPAGLVSAVQGPTKVLFRLPFLVMYATPFFVSGALLLVAAARWAPSIYAVSYSPLSQGLGSNLRSMLLPAISVGFPAAGVLMQMTRSAALNVLNQPHILAARGNGIGTWRIHCIYALKAALVPILNLEGFLFGILVGSLVVVENVFSLPGLGRGVLSSFQNRDFLELNGQALVLTSVFILGNLIVDLLMPLVDPRVATN